MVWKKKKQQTEKGDAMITLKMFENVMLGEIAQSIVFITYNQYMSTTEVIMDMWKRHMRPMKFSELVKLSQLGVFKETVSSGVVVALGSPVEIGVLHANALIVDEKGSEWQTPNAEPEHGWREDIIFVAIVND
jgi:hypothetical protein